MTNASFGADAEAMQSPEYRDNRNRTVLEMEMLPDLLSGKEAWTSPPVSATAMPPL